MDNTIVVEPAPSGGFRATASHTFAVTAEASTREEATAQATAGLLKEIQDEARRLHLLSRTKPLWPDDELTREFLAIMAANREAANARAESWEEAEVP